MLSRRSLLGGLAATAVAQHGLIGAAAAGMAPSPDPKGQAPEAGKALPPWMPGTFDIHHLGYGRGDATFIIMPDGTSLLIDAGAVAGDDPALVPAARGVGSDAGAWIAGYIRRHLAATGRPRLDAAIVTHLHLDHIGEARSGPSERTGTASHEATGMSAVAAAIEIRTLHDPYWPDYGYPPFEGRASAENYVVFVRHRARAGRPVRRLAVGDTIASGLAAGVPWSIRTVAARGRVWTGVGQAARELFPPSDMLAPGDWPNENAMSAAFLLSYGPFRYFAGGDLTDWGDAGARVWMNALTPAARVAGPVHVSTVPHHGMFDASSSETVRALAARDWVISAWHAAHPSPSTLERLFNPRLYPGPRDVWTTALHPAAELSMARLAGKLSNTFGTVVCRICAGGGTYQMIVTDRDVARDCVVLVSDARTTAAR